MIIDHQYLSKEFLQNKEFIQITKDNPVMVFINDKNSQIFDYSLQKMFKFSKIHHELKELKNSQLQENQQLMKHQLPLIMFSRYILQRNQVIEMVTDIGLSSNKLIQYECRKSYIKKIISNWFDIAEFQKLGKGNWGYLKKLGVRSEIEYKNFIFNELISLQFHFHKNILSKQFQNYSHTIPVLENFVFVDIIEYIVQKLPESYPDFYLRANFPHLIELKDKLKKMIEKKEQEVGEDFIQKRMVIEKYRQEKHKQMQLFVGKHKYFIGVFSLIGFIFWKYTKND